MDPSIADKMRSLIGIHAFATLHLPHAKDPLVLWLTVFQRKILPLYPLLTLFTVHETTIGCHAEHLAEQQDEQGVKESRVIRIMLALGAVASAQDSDIDLNTYSEWIGDIIQELNAVVPESILDIRAFVLGVLLAIHSPLIFDIWERLYLPCLELAAVLENDSIDLANDDNILTVWTFIFLAFESLPPSRCKHFLPVIHSMARRIPDNKCIEGNIIHRSFAEIARLVQDIGEIPIHPSSPIMDGSDSISQSAHPLVYTTRALAFRRVRLSTMNDSDRAAALNKEFQALVGLLFAIRDLPTTSRLFYKNQVCDCVIRIDQLVVLADSIIGTNSQSAQMSVWRRFRTNPPSIYLTKKLGYRA